MPNQFDVPITDGKIPDLISGAPLVVTPEEIVRQRYLRILHHEYGYPVEVMRREVPIYNGRNEVADTRGNPVRADIVVYHNALAATNRDQGQVLFIVECKAPTEQDGHNQLVSYVFNTSAEGGVWYNGSGDDYELRYFKKYDNPQRLDPYIGIPRHGSTWDSVGRRRISELERPRDIKGLFRRCHNKLHARGSGSDEEDLTLDMVRIIMAKARDEESASDYGEFYCTAEEYKDAARRQVVGERVRRLFEEVRNENRDVFSEHEQIRVSDDAICDVVIELQEYRLMSNLYESHDWDLMGAAYEQYTEVSMKRQKGQFFTNRLVVEFMVSLADPDKDDVILDPAGGSGGFLTGSMRHVRRKILSSSAGEAAKQRSIDKHRAKLFMVEQSGRLVKIAKTAMILNGDGHAGMTKGNSLGPYSNFDSTIQGKANRGVPTVILTNPPFAGVGEGRITQGDLLTTYQTGHRWDYFQEEYRRSGDLLPGGAPPEMLFFERSLDWLAPGGTLAIVLPKSFLDTQTYKAARTLLFQQAKLLGVVNLHKDTFQPHTGVRTCIVLLQKLKEAEEVPEDYPVFMGVSRKIGQDSEGYPIYKRDEQGKETEDIDHDLNDLLAAYEALKAGTFTPSQYAFSINFSEIDDQLNINPQRYLPHLNETLEAVTSIDGVDGWSVTTVGQITSGVRIFKGPRWRSSDLVVEEESESTIRYYVPTAVLQENGDSAKILDTTHAGARRMAVIESLKVREGDLLITRSGSNGRIAYVDRRMAETVVSDDMIRVRIPDENLRLYTLHYLKTKYAQDQLARNEYGAVQQHLEPQHLKDMLIPLPDDADLMRDIVTNVKRSLLAREIFVTRNNRAREALLTAIASALEAHEEAAQDGTGDEEQQDTDLTIT